MSVGMVPPWPAYTLDPATIARKAEELGFGFIWYHEHPIFPVKSDSPFPAFGGDKVTFQNPISLYRCCGFTPAA